MALPYPTATPMETKSDPQTKKARTISPNLREGATVALVKRSQAQLKPLNRGMWTRMAFRLRSSGLSESLRSSRSSKSSSESTYAPSKSRKSQLKRRRETKTRLTRRKRPKMLKKSTQKRKLKIQTKLRAPVRRIP